MTDGSAFICKDIEAEATPDSMTVGVANSEGLPITSASEPTVSQKAQSVNNSIRSQNENNTSDIKWTADGYTHDIGKILEGVSKTII